MRNRLQYFKKIDTQMDEAQNKITEIFTLINELFDMRIIEKISRPVIYIQKQKIYLDYKQKFMYLHQLMTHVQKEYFQQNKEAVDKNRSNKSTIGNKIKYAKLDIQRIESKYTEVFIEGSFRYYYRVAKVFGLPTDLQTINIEEWVSETLKSDGENKCC